MNQASVDGKFELRLVQCDGTCHLAPLIRHQGKYIGPLTTSEAIEFARALKPAAPAPASARPAPEAARIVATYAELREAADEAWAPFADPQRPLIKVGVATCSRVVGAEETLAAIRERGRSRAAWTPT